MIMISITEPDFQLTPTDERYSHEHELNKRLFILFVPHSWGSHKKKKKAVQPSCDKDVNCRTAPLHIHPQSEDCTGSQKYQFYYQDDE